MVQDIPPLQTYAIIQYGTIIETEIPQHFMFFLFLDHIHTELVNLCLIYTYTLDHSSIELVNGVKDLKSSNQPISHRHT